ncbi:unnamed protein product [Closterium sp. NIES-64]|nr:unnamed protein product [Closterium sp. NIES-64]
MGKWASGSSRSVLLHRLSIKISFSLTLPSLLRVITLPPLLPLSPSLFPSPSSSAPTSPSPSSPRSPSPAQAIRGKIYDVTRGKHFYGPGGPYEVFAGKEASRAFAKMSTDPKDAVGDLTGLTYSEMETLRDWESSLQFKYDVVGSVKGSGGGVGGGDAAGGAGGAGETQGEGGGAEADAGTVAAEGEGGEGEEGGEKGAGGD